MRGNPGFPVAAGSNAACKKERRTEAPEMPDLLGFFEWLGD
jgi:hypothetical protein